MQIPEANIQITRTNGRLSSISVSMPIWNKHSDQGNLLVALPMLGIETVATDEIDAEKAIEEAITSFCIVSEKFGQGLDKELQALNWIQVENESGDPVLGYNLSKPDDVIERILQTGDNYINPFLEIA